MNAPAHSDTALAAAALQGDRQAFGELVLRYREGVFGMLARMFGDPDLADEASQVAFLKAWQKLHTYQPERPFGAWVRSIAVRAALDLLRKERHTSPLDELPLPDGAPGPETQVEMRQRGESVRRAVLGLPPASRAVLVLREYEQFSYQEIAVTLEIPLGTVMSRLNYARAHLRRALERELGEPG